MKTIKSVGKETHIIYDSERTYLRVMQLVIPEITRNNRIIHFLAIKADAETRLLS